MKKFTFLLFGSLLLFTNCSEKEGQDKQKNVDMVTTRTLGLAYLEENRLAEAETEFLKLVGIAPDEPLGYANLGLVYMRMGKYSEAEEQVKKSLEIEPNDPDIRLNLAEIYELTNREAEAVDLLAASLTQSPDHIRTHYKLAQIYRKSPAEKNQSQVERHLAKVVEKSPANIPARLQFLETLIRGGEADEARTHFEELRRQMPELPKESLGFFKQALAALETGNVQEALPLTMIFHNFMRVTSLYQAGLQELKGPAGPLMGTPLLTFSQDISLQMQAQESILEAMRFTDATGTSGLSLVSDSLKSQSATTIIAVADFDRDRDQDIYVGRWVADQKRNLNFLFKNEFGIFENISQQVGIAHGGQDQDAIFADYDNDGFLDLFILNSENNRLYKNVAEGKFSDVASAAGVTGSGKGQAAHFADFDHDGDLDLHISNSERNQLFRNNLDGSFTELAEKMQIAGSATASRDIAFGDFDDDGDLDFFVVTEGGNILYSNRRQGQFEDITTRSGLTSAGGGAVTAGDYNNDGFLDLFVAGLENDGSFLFKNKGDGTFKKDTGSSELFQALKNVAGFDTRFFDFDNDGFLDLLVVGKANNGRGVLLFHNDGTGEFSDVSHLLPDDIISASSIAVADYNEDGDLDIFLAEFDGGIRLLRNDGGNANKYLKLELVGIRTGSGKNNHFGIGSKLEVRAGDLYQIRIIDEPVTHLGLGQRLKADVVRILWPNGVPQNLFYPGSDQDLVEEQTLKGSCAFVYGWDGEKYEFVTDVMWRSALGMPLGIMGGETAYAFPNSSRDYFRIPGDMLQEKNGVYSLQVTEELWETAYWDEVKLLAIDHPDSIDIYIDERFVPPPAPPLKIYPVSKRQPPKTAIDDRGNDLLETIRHKDDHYVSNLIPEKYQGVTQLHDLILDLGDLSESKEVTLFLNGWIFPTDASINIALAQSNDLKVIMPHLQVMNEKGEWQTVIENLSFPMGKNKMVVADLTDRFLTNDYRVRIRTNMQIYWDTIFYTVDEPHFAISKTELTLKSADLHSRGFSRLYHKGGPYGPHWFDYGDVSTEQKWRDLIGNYTRYGDVKPLLLEPDDKYVIVNAGDEVTLEFDAASAPPLKPGWTRDFLIYTDGWIKDGDLNTAHGKTVEPLPYHGMSSYPYGPGDSYPMDEEYREYLKKYNTRKVTTERFREAILQGLDR